MRRGPLIPAEVPRWRSRSELFDQAVLDAYAPIAEKWRSRLTHLDIAVDMVPRMRIRPHTIFPEEIIADGQVPLARLIPAGVDRAGKPTRPCIVVFRRAIEKRANDAEELSQLLSSLMTQLVAVYLSVFPTDIDPDFQEWEF